MYHVGLMSEDTRDPEPQKHWVLFSDHKIDREGTSGATALNRARDDSRRGPEREDVGFAGVCATDSHELLLQ